VYSSRRPGEASGIVSLIVGNVEAVVQRCQQAGIVVNQRAGRLRVSPHAYNSIEELDRLVALIGAGS
jgi:cysteine desulfurase/selenocysteine lyase